MNRVETGSVQVGEPLPFDCFDRAGVLLLRRGHVIESAWQLEQLIERGLFRWDMKERGPEPSARGSAKDSPFALLERFKLRLGGTLRALVDADPQAPAQVLAAVEEIQAICAQDPCAALGALHLDQGDRYTILHPLQVSTLSELIALRRELAPEARRSIVAGALTANIALTGLQEVLQKQRGPLSEEQRSALMAHPAQGADILRRAGVADETWINAVAQHHERLDGSGYPAALKAPEIDLAARIVALADRYGAMVSPRSYRTPLLARNALRDIFLQRACGIDAGLAQLLIKELGVFPPGSFVRLQNGEVAVVIRRRADASATCPVVKSVIGPRGAVLPFPVNRDTRDSRFAIKEMVARDPAVTIDFEALWGYR
ncbi:MAG: HD domain-containing protein [Betaproteobacteria bacterium]|nr:HD domain-containing protein [Betaproteobacteria bacterium]